MLIWPLWCADKDRPRKPGHDSVTTLGLPAKAIAGAENGGTVPAALGKWVRSHDTRGTGFDGEDGQPYRRRERPEQVHRIVPRLDELQEKRKKTDSIRVSVRIQARMARLGL